MKKFHELEIDDIKRETADCVVIRFKIPKELREAFSFKQGQYLTLKRTIDGEDLRRSYSLCSSPFEDQWKVAVKQVEDGRFSSFVNRELKTGDHMEVFPPDGHFFMEIDPERTGEIIAFAAGSGITPVMSILKAHLDKEPQINFKLFYLNRKKDTIIFRDELDELQKTYEGRLEVHHFLSRENADDPLFEGRFTPEKIRELSNGYFDINKLKGCFICGPEEMIFSLKDELTSLGIEEKKIHFELFEVSSSDDVKSNGLDYIDNAEVTAIVDGEEFTFNVPGGTSILEAAEQNDADVPFSCKGGVCCTCKAKLLEGTVKMVVNYGLDETDLANNLVLTCQSMPTAQKVIVDYDDVY